MCKCNNYHSLPQLWSNLNVSRCKLVSKCLLCHKDDSEIVDKADNQPLKYPQTPLNETILRKSATRWRLPPYLYLWISETFRSFMQARRGLVGDQQSAHASTRKRSTYFHFSVQFNTVKTGCFDSSSSSVVSQACQRTRSYRTSTASIDLLNAFLSSGSRRKVRQQLSRNFRVSITSPLNA